MEIELRRKVDLSSSRTKKLLRCEKYFDEILKDAVVKDYTPAVCLRLMRNVCEVRNKALQANEKQFKRFSIGGMFFRRDARQDIALFMGCLKRRLGGKFPNDKAFAPLHLYVATQRNYLSG